MFRVGEDAAVVARSLVRLPCALRISLQPETGALQLDEAEAGVDRYYSAFETGRLPEGRFAKRIEALERRLADLRARKVALEESTATRPEVPTGLVIRETAEAIAEAMTRGTLQQRKALLQQLVAGVEVSSREEIVPTFRIPATPVRVMDRMVGGPGLEPGWVSPHAPQTCASTCSASRPAEAPN